jgi:hypothetical protein
MMHEAYSGVAGADSVASGGGAKKRPAGSKTNFWSDLRTYDLYSKVRILSFLYFSPAAELMTYAYRTS